MENLIVKEVDVKTATDEELIVIFDFSDVLFKESDPDDPLPPLDLRLKAVRQDNPERKMHRFYAYLEEKIVASGRIGFSTPKDPGYEKNKKMAMISVNVLPEYRRQGLATKMLGLCMEKAMENNDVEVIASGTDTDTGYEFSKHLGGNVGLEAAENRLRMEEIDWDMIDTWSAEGKALAEKEDVTTLMFESCPEELIEEYCVIYGETMNQQPLGDLDVDLATTPEVRRKQEKQNEELGVKWWTLITKEKDGRISGLTELFYLPSMSWRMMQNLTGVKEEYRGRGLGKWLKADMLQFVRNNEELNEVKYITTGNADTNAPMLSINKRMGYKRHKNSFQFTFNKDELAQKMGMKVIAKH